MAKKIGHVVKMQIPAGQATPAPPIGTALGPVGINIGDFCSQFNTASQDRQGDIVPVILTVYEDKTFDFILKTPPASFLLRKAAGIDKGSGKNLVKRAGTINRKALTEIAEQKMQDLNARDIAAAEKILEGTARSMGISIS
ncbi:MAG: 50S ribosomal protein L11 [Candidatus Kaiserbacteria bacterium]|nr:50S ribosomal protein L11 [Candidatus Kaiserbacteria bacterium]